MSHTHRNIIIGICAAAILLLAAGLVIAKEEAPAKVDLSHYKGAKAVVKFEHKNHIDAKVECRACHHIKKDKKDVKCSECHKKDAEDKTPGFKDAFHKACKGCHVKKLEKNKDLKVPTKCNECHK